MLHEVVEFSDADTLADGAVEYVTRVARRCVAATGTFTFAVSGGRTPWQMFDRLRSADMPWESTVLFQVDERIAPASDPDRNLANLRMALGDVATRVVAMPVEDTDLDAAADQYAALVPERLDLVHLGLGPDGHTASLVPGDPVLDVRDRLVATTEPYLGHRRMTLTYAALARSDRLLWLVSGSDKHVALVKLLAGDESIPAARVVAPRSLVMADRSAIRP